MIDKNRETKVVDYIKEKEQVSGISDIQENLESLGLETKLFKWLKSDKKMLDYANLFLKENLKGEKRSFIEELTMLSLEAQLSIRCSYFGDFKHFLSELENQKDNFTDSSPVVENQDKSVDLGKSVEIKNIGFMGTPISQIKSSPFYRHPISKITWCSATAWFNSKHFNLNLPRGDAYNAGTKPGSECLDTIPSNKKNQRPNNGWGNISLAEFTKINDNSKANFADIYTDSRSTYGHRVVGFKSSDGQWYVLDPYNNVNGLNDKPKLLADYMQKKGIKKVHFYESKGYNYKQYEYGNA